MTSWCAHPRGRDFALCLVVLAALASPRVASAQCFEGRVPDGTPYPCRFRAPRWSGELASLGANALIGGLTAGVVQALRDGGFSTGFTRGALGGVVSYAGKRIAAESFEGAGLIGRQVAAVGASASRNAALGAPLFSHLTLPLGPVWLDVRRGEQSGVRARVDPAALGWILYAAAESELHFDLGQSLSSGAAVFRTRGKLLSFGDDSVHAGGVANAGIVYLSDVAAYGREYRRRVETHERIHALQQDQLAILWTMPAGEWAMRRSGWFARVAPHIAINLSTEMMRLTAPLFDTHEDRPWELEAIFHAR